MATTALITLLLTSGVGLGWLLRSVMGYLFSDKPRNLGLLVHVSGRCGSVTNRMHRSAGFSAIFKFLLSSAFVSSCVMVSSFAIKLPKRYRVDVLKHGCRIRQKCFGPVDEFEPPSHDLAQCLRQNCGT